MWTVWRWGLILLLLAPLVLVVGVWIFLPIVRLPEGQRILATLVILSFEISVISVVYQFSKPFPLLSIRDRGDHIALILDPRQSRPGWIESVYVRVGSRELNLPEEVSCRVIGGGKLALPMLFNHQTVLLVSKDELKETARCKVCRRHSTSARSIKFIVGDVRGNKPGTRNLRIY